MTYSDSPSPSMSTLCAGKARSSFARARAVAGTRKGTQMPPDMAGKTTAMPRKIMKMVNTRDAVVVGDRSPYPTVEHVMEAK